MNTRQLVFATRFVLLFLLFLASACGGDGNPFGVKSEPVTAADRAAAMGRAAREQVIAHWSVERMVEGYHELIEGIYTSKCADRPSSDCEAAYIGGGDLASTVPRPIAHDQ